MAVSDYEGGGFPHTPERIHPSEQPSGARAQLTGSPAQLSGPAAQLSKRGCSTEQARLLLSRRAAQLSRSVCSVEQIRLLS